MFFPIFLVILSFSRCALSNSTDTSQDERKEIEYSEGTSVEAKYSLPLVKVGDSSENPNNVVPSSLQRMLNFYNTEKLMTNWPKFKHKISKDCQKDLDIYIEGLRGTENWALKMDDASGRYSTGWFWGNNYWVGSQSLCDHIEPKSKNIIVNSQDRMLSIGVCLPNACKDEDVKNIMEETSATSTQITVQVISVKSQHNRYNMWQDSTFWTLGIVSAVMICFLIAGTAFDYYLEHQKNKKLATVTQRFSLPNLRSSNGKGGIYVVNTSSNHDGNNNGNLTALDVNASASTAPRETVARLILRELLLAFSVKTNLRVICDQTVGSDTLPVLHGLKSISMAWVILGHTCIVLFKYSDNMEYRKVVQKKFLFQTITNGAFSVDTFFFVSGLLVSFLYFRTNAKGKLAPLSKGRNGFIAGVLHFLGLIFYRFARLTAPYLFALGLTEVTMKWFYYNSVFIPPAMDHVNCPKYWWRNLLYINTLFPMKDMCMLWSWYLSDDTQFYVVGAVILIIATSHFKSATSLLIIFGASSWMTTGYIAYSNSHMPGNDDPLALFDKIYDKPWTRLGPYLVGMCVGWLLFKKNCIIPMSKLILTAGWTVSIGILLALIYGLYEVNLSPIAGAAYSSLSHSAWALSLAWIVVACVTGHGGMVNTILSMPMLYPFSRVTYCAYLVHPLLIRGMVMTMDSPLHLGLPTTIIIFLGQAVASYFLAFVLSVGFEAPIVSMLRIITKVVAHKQRVSSRSHSEKC